MKQRLTPLGIEVKKRLLDMNLTQREFCEKYNIPVNRFSELLTGFQPNHKYKKLVCKVLKIEEIA